MRDIMCGTCAMQYPADLPWPPDENDLDAAETAHRKHDGAHYAIWYDEELNCYSVG